MIEFLRRFLKLFGEVNRVEEKKVYKVDRFDKEIRSYCLEWAKTHPIK